MTLIEKVGQLFMVGFTGKKMDRDLRRFIENYHIGGIIYFRRNIESPEQLAELSAQLQETAAGSGAGLPLFISIDQEGGVVNRLRGGTHFPGLMALGAAGSEELAEKAGKVIAREIKA